MVFDGNTATPGSGNGNKMNRRNENFTEYMESLGNQPSALRNSLRRAIQRNNTDMAESAIQTLDLLRQVNQETFNEEIKNLIDRHLRTTFYDAFRNLRRNNVDVSSDDVNELYRRILDDAKDAISPTTPFPLLSRVSGRPSVLRQSNECPGCQKEWNPRNAVVPTPPTRRRHRDHISSQATSSSCISNSPRSSADGMNRSSGIPSFDASSSSACILYPLGCRPR